MALCKYRGVFGMPRDGVHSTRFIGMAAVDLVATLGIALGISMWTRANMLAVFAGLMALAIVIHRLFCVNTAINKLIFGKLG
jgi:hypothetical protein